MMKKIMSKTAGAAAATSSSAVTKAAAAGAAASSCRSWHRGVSRILFYATQTWSSSAFCSFPRHLSSASFWNGGSSATDETRSSSSVFSGAKPEIRARSFSAISSSTVCAATIRYSSSLLAFISTNNPSGRSQRLRHGTTTSSYSLHSQQTFPRLSIFATTTSIATNHEVVNEDYSCLGRQTQAEMLLTRDCRIIIDSAIQAVNPVEAIRNHVRRRRVRVNTNDDDDDEKDYCSSQQWIEIGSQTGPSSAAANNSASCRTYNLNDYDKILIVAFGKASSAMASAVVHQLVGRPENTKTDDKNTNNNNIHDISNKLAGIVIVKDGHATKQELDCLAMYNIKVWEASHPVPDQRGVDASRQLLELVEKSSSSSSSSHDGTLVIACISGGGSALFCTPHPTLTLDDLQRTNQFLLQCGWSIQEMNIIRKRLELGKGGGVLQAATNAGANADLVSLVLSDVLGDPLDLIASGPTVPDTSTARDAWNLLQRVPNYDEALPTAVVRLIQDQVKQQEHEEGQPPQIENSCNDDNSKLQQKAPFTCLVGNNALAVSAAARQAATLGYTPIVLGTQIEGEASTVAQVLVGMAQHVIATSGGNRSNERKSSDFAMVSSLPAALIMGGETTVTLPSSNAEAAGKGGRNQELALSAALALRKYNLRQVVVASVGTDGTDGPTDAAGAIVDGGTIDRLFHSQKTSKKDAGSASTPLTNSTPENEAIRVLERHDSYHYLARTDGEGNSPLVKTGPTGTNVADIMLVLVHGDK